MKKPDTALRMIELRDSMRAANHKDWKEIIYPVTCIVRRQMALMQTDNALDAALELLKGDEDNTKMGTVLLAAAIEIIDPTC